LIIATRPSSLARWQTHWVIKALVNAWPGLVCHEKIILTQGDRVLDRSLPEIGGKGLFTQELEAEILSGRVQAAVHSLKDLPIDFPIGLTIGAIPARGEARDVLVSCQGYTLDSLPERARVGTSSLRRAAQLLAARQDLEMISLRGNVDTRVRKALQGEYDAILVAGAGLLRLGLEDAISQWLPLDLMLPAPGQGALAVQCRRDDERVLEYLAPIEDDASRRSVEAERAFLAALGGGCSLPIAAHAAYSGGQIELRGLVASPDGKKVIHCQGQGLDPIQLGQECACQAFDQGAEELLHPHPTALRL